MRRLALLCLALLTVSAGCLSSNQQEGLSGEALPEPFAPEAFNFLVVGDWGRNGFFNQREVGQQMGQTGAEIESRFTISTGDNFYSAGVTSTTDPKWQRSFEDVYTAPVLQRPWYAVLGNHDWQGDVEAQVAYTRLSERWTMPSLYFTVEHAVDDSTRALFVFLDTTPLADPDRTYLYPQSTRLWDRSAQLRWLDSTLAASTAHWKVVVGHHPVYVASSKYEDNPYLLSDLVPILERHGVQAYFAGHDHNLQHLHPEGSPVHYFVSGAGSLTRAVDPEDPDALFALRVPGFMAVSMTALQMYVQAYDEHGHLYYFTNVTVGEDAWPSAPEGGAATPAGTPGPSEPRQ
jgi:tartrate-resistant acid phosphatase type 5